MLASTDRSPLTASGIAARSIGAPILIFCGLLVPAIWRLDAIPPWWDEGWTLSVARLWTERGFYGRLLDGQPIGAGLNASPLVTLPVAWLMHIFGVGLWQGRLFGALCTALALTLLFLIAKRGWNARIAYGALAVALLLPSYPQLNTLILGRQVLGELPMLAALLGGLVLLPPLLARRWGPLLVLPIGALWACALLIKAQTEPFWLASIAALLLGMARRRAWRELGLVAAAAITSWLLRAPIIGATTAIYAGHTAEGQQLIGLYNVTAFVPDILNRQYALTTVLEFAIIPVVALGIACWAWLRGGWRGLDAPAYALRVVLLGFAGSWTAWYLLLSVGWPRYLCPALLLATPFAADWLASLIGPTFLASLIAPLRGTFSRATGGAWLATLLIATSLPLAMLNYQYYYGKTYDHPSQRVAAYLNQHTPPGGRVETYEAQLYFLLDVPYHFPPDQIHVELIRREMLTNQQPLAYDPLAADPDYLVVGPFTSQTNLYTATIASGAFSEVLHDGPYTVYRRVR